MKSLRVLVLRAEGDARQTAFALARSGHETVLAPLLRIEPTGEPIPDGPFDGVVITSAHAVPVLGASFPTVPTPAEPGATPFSLIALPVFAVGDRSAEAARAAGFSDVRSARGTRAELAALLASAMKPNARLLLALGRDHKADLAPRLTEVGFRPVVWLAYEALAATELPAVAVHELKTGTIDAVLHYSRRSAEIFIALAARAGLGPQHQAWHIVLSEDIAEPLRVAKAGPVAIAARPDEEALIATLNEKAWSNRPRNSFVTGDKPEEHAGLRADAITRPSVGENMSPADNDLPDPPRQASRASERARARRTPPTIEGEMTNTTTMPPVSEPTAGTGAGPHAESGSVGAKAIDAVEMETGTAAADPSGVHAETKPSSSLGDNSSKTSVPDETVAPSADSTPDPAPEPVAATPPGSSRGRAGVIAAGLLGGLLGLGLALGLPRLVPALDAGDARLTDLQRRISQLQDQAASKQALQGVETKLGAAAMLAAKAEADAAVVSQRLGQLLSSAPGGSDPASIASIADRARRAEAQAAETASRLTTLEQAARSPAEPTPALRASLRLVLLDRIDKALDSGRPFAADLQALGLSDLAPASAKALEAVAQSGVVPLGALQAEFRALRPALEREGTSEAPALTDRLLRLVQSAISVRPLGAQQGGSTSAIVSRLGQALSSGDSMKAAAEWAALPEPARRAGTEFGQRLSARAAAEQAVADLSNEALESLKRGSLK
jgi:uroporphyrinogen-III synthase